MPQQSLARLRRGASNRDPRLARTVAVAEPHLAALPELKAASYAARCEAFCRKLARERHWNAAAFLLSDRVTGPPGGYSVPAEDLRFELFEKSLLAQVMAYKDRAMQFAVTTLAPTTHRLYQGDARSFPYIADESVHLVVTSPPDWTLKRYNPCPGQLGHVESHEQFLQQLERVWAEVYRVLVPGGRLVCVVRDVCLARRTHGWHLVMPLHADMCVMCRRLGFDNLNPIIWHKISNAAFEADTFSKILGKPYEPNAIIKNGIEFILMQRKPGGYRQPTEQQRRLSLIPKEEFSQWFRQIWTLPGASSKEHPAPFPLELAIRLIRMFSFVGDTVLDPFCGTGTTMLAAMKWGRNSLGIEIDPAYCRVAEQRLQQESQTLFGSAQFQLLRAPTAEPAPAALNEEADSSKTTLGKRRRT